MQPIVLFVHVDLFSIKRVPTSWKKIFKYHDTQYNFYETIPDIVLIQKSLFLWFVLQFFRIVVQHFRQCCMILAMSVGQNNGLIVSISLFVMCSSSAISY